MTGSRPSGHRSGRLLYLVRPIVQMHTRVGELHFLWARSLVDNSTAEQTDNTHGGAGHWLSPLGCKPDALRLWRFESAPHHRALAGAPGTATADLRSSRDRARRYERRGRGSSPRGGAAGTRAARRRHGCEGDGQPIRFGSGRHRVRLAGIRRRRPRAATQSDARWSRSAWTPDSESGDRGSNPRRAARPPWRNGRRTRLRPARPHGHAGSTPAGGTHDLGGLGTGLLPRGPGPTVPARVRSARPPRARGGAWRSVQRPDEATDQVRLLTPRRLRRR
jgi:hypothetical protein